MSLQFTQMQKQKDSAQKSAKKRKEYQKDRNPNHITSTLNLLSPSLAKQDIGIEKGNFKITSSVLFYLDSHMPGIGGISCAAANRCTLLCEGGEKKKGWWTVSDTSPSPVSSLYLADNLASA